MKEKPNGYFLPVFSTLWVIRLIRLQHCKNYVCNFSLTLILDIFKKLQVIWELWLWHVDATERLWVQFQLSLSLELLVPNCFVLAYTQHG